MADNVRLLHTHFRGSRMFYFYDGETMVEDGVISLSTDHPERIQRAWIMGHRLDPETGEFRDLASLLDSREERNEDSDSGRLTGPENGVRDSKSSSRGNAAKSKPRNRVRGRSGKSRKESTDPSRSA